MISFTAFGVPQPKGSTRSFVFKGRAVTTNANAKTKPWQKVVRDAAAVAFAMRQPYAGAVVVDLVFAMPRPKTVKRIAHTVKPDLDKLTRTVLDALTGVAYVDDSQVVEILVRKSYVVNDGKPSVSVSVGEVKYE